MSYKVYSKKRPYSYTWGAFPTFELIDRKPEWIEAVLVHTKTDQAIRHELAKRIDPTMIRQDDRLLEKLAQRENVYVLGIFRPNWPALDQSDHIVLDEPSNFGNLGTIIRTALGLGYNNIALIGPACDETHPQVIRASMGAVFAMHIDRFPSIEDYRQVFPEHTLFAFMGGGTLEVSQLENIETPYSLIFGNESRGLDESIRQMATPVSIAMTPDVDSFNITIAAGIGMYVFRQHLVKQSSLQSI